MRTPTRGAVPVAGRPRRILRLSPDAVLFEMIERHKSLFREMDRLVGLHGDDASDLLEYEAASHEAMDLEDRIVATRANTRKGLGAKWRFICKTEYVSDRGLDTGDLNSLVAMILRMDVETIGASIPALEAEGITASKRFAGPGEREALATERRCQNAAAWLSKVDEDGCSAEEREAAAR
jgi:hypothetical protein